MKKFALTAAAVVIAGAASIGIVRPAEAADPHSISLSLQLAGTSCTAALAQAANNGDGDGTTAEANDNDVTADSSQAIALCAYVETGTTVGAGTAAPGIPVVFTVSVGYVSTGTSKSTTVITGSSGTATTTYRGAGNIATTDTVIASYNAGNAVATESVDLTAPTGNTATKVQFLSPSVLAIAPTVTNTSPNYQSPQTGADITVQVTDASGLGVNSQVVLVTVDRGAIVSDPGYATAIATACNGVTAKSVTVTTGSNVATRGAGTNTAGVANLIVCGNQTDAAGKLTLTAQNISTTMDNATSSVSMAGRPAKIEATATGNAITAKVTDAGGNNVADGTPVRFTISANAGAVSTACTTTTNGQASSVVALIAATGTVIVSSDWNETGASSTCTTAGAQQVAASVTVPGGSTGGAAGGTGTISSGSIPAAGGFGLVVYGGPINALVTASGCPSATAAFWATVNGNFVTYVPGTTIGAVNADFMAAFPNGIPAGTPLIGKCK